jgi:hypothetical protein
MSNLTDCSIYNKNEELRENYGKNFVALKTGVKSNQLKKFDPQ